MQSKEMSDKQTNFIMEALKQAKRTWTIYSFFIAYALLSTLSTSDRQILLNDSVNLPIINSEVPLSAFFIITPLLTMILFLYFHIQLYILREAIQHKDNNHSGTPRRLYPWIVLVAEEPDPGVIGWFQKGFLNISIWWSLPIALMLYAIWIIKKHNPWLSYVVGLMPIVGIVLLIIFWCKYHRISFVDFLRERTMMRILTAVILFNIFLLFILIPWANEGKHFGLRKDAYRPSYSTGILPTIGNFFLIIDLRDEILSIKPAADHSSNYWTDLSNIHLEGADLARSVLKRANLQNSYLQSANLTSADLSEAKLSGANLYGAWLGNSTLKAARLNAANLAGIFAPYANLRNSSPSQANLDGADLSYSNLEGARLYNSNLENAQLYKANLRQANLRNVNFRRALLAQADFSGADLENAWFDEAILRNVKNLTVGQLSKAKTLYKAIMDPCMKKNIALYYPRLLEKPIEKNRPGAKFEKIFPGWHKGPDWFQINKGIYKEEDISDCPKNLKPH